MEIRTLTDKNENAVSSRQQSTSILLYGLHYMDANKTAGEEARWLLHKNAACNPEQVPGSKHPHKDTKLYGPPAPYNEKLFKLDEPDMAGDTAGEAEMNS